MSLRSAFAMCLLVSCGGPRDTAFVPIDPYDPLDMVDVFIGSDTIGVNFGAVSPAARRPFGMVSAGPDTRGPLGSPPFSYSGYFYLDDRIAAFSHTHSEGMGVVDFGAVGFMPKNGWDPLWTTDAGRESVFSHEEEWGTPGTYGVRLPDEGVTVDIAAHERSAIHRYGFDSGTEPVVVLDLGHTIGNVTIAEARASLDGAEIEGFQRVAGAYSGRYGGHQTSFVAQFEPPPTSARGWLQPEVVEDGLDSVEGPASGLALSFPPGTEQVLMKVGISYVDVEGARGNLQAEIPGWDMESALAAAEDAWRAEMSNVRVAGGTDEERVIFHSALYRAYHMPTVHSDVDGRYRGLDDEIHSSDRLVYSTFSLWDTFRTQHPWLILARPQRQVDMVQSLVQHTRDGGSLPRWPMTHGYTGGMVGTPADQVFAETWLKGLRSDWDVDDAWEMAVRQSTQPMPHASRTGIGGYLERGYVVYEEGNAPAALTLEYAWSDASMALWGADMGKPEAEDFDRMRHGWKGLWHEPSGFLQGRYLDGTFDVPNDVTAWSDAFVEGNAWHYVWGAPHDVDGMVEVQHGGDTDAWLARMRNFWEDTDRYDEEFLADPYYWHGNEPDLHYPFLGALAGDMTLTSEAARYVMDTRYSTLPSGIDGNDDSGTLSAWYLFASSGLYPIAGTMTYAVSSPLFSRIEIDQPEGEPLVVAAPGLEEGGRVVRAAHLGEQELSGSFDHADYVSERLLVLEME